MEFRFSIYEDAFCIFFLYGIFSLFYKICYNVEVIKEEYYEAKIFTNDDAILGN